MGKCVWQCIPQTTMYTMMHKIVIHWLVKKIGEILNFLDFTTVHIQMQRVHSLFQDETHFWHYQNTFVINCSKTFIIHLLCTVLANRYIESAIQMTRIQSWSVFVPTDTDSAKPFRAILVWSPFSWTGLWNFQVFMQDDFNGISQFSPLTLVVGGLGAGGPIGQNGSANER